MGMTKMKNARFQKVFEIIKILRSEKGCPWDKEQHFPTYARLLREELNELNSAIKDGKTDEIAEELGDVAWNCLYLLYLGEEEMNLKISRVLEGVLKKIVRRHPHVFGDTVAKTPEEVLIHWQRIKEKEKKGQKVKQRKK